MTLLRRFLAWPAVALAILALPAVRLPGVRLTAQDLKPVAVVSIASVEKNLSDVVYLTSLVGMEDTGKTAQLFGNALTAGMDKSRPSGLLVLPAGTDFQAVAFIPVTNLKLLLEVHKEQVGEPQDVGGSILEIGKDRKAFVKEQAGWAFVAEKKELLTALPPDPLQLLGDLPQKYNIAARVFVQNVPAELRKKSLEEFKAGFEQAMKAQAANAPPGAAANPNRVQAEVAMKAYLQQIEQVLNDAQDISLGLAVNAEQKNVSLDLVVAARDGTELARRMALQTNLKSSFSGFALPEAAVFATYTAMLTENEVAQAKALVRSQREQFLQQIDVVGPAATLPPEQKEAFKQFLNRLYDAIEQITGNRSDGGAVLVLDSQSFNLVTGAYVTDGAVIEKHLKDIAELTKTQPAGATTKIELTLNVGAHADIKLHRGSWTLPQENAAARNLIGDKLEFLLGTGKESYYLCIGKESEALLKKVIDRSAAQASQPAQPFQMTISALPIAKFFQAQQAQNPLVAPLIGGLVASLEQEGGDKLVVQGTAGPKSVAYRLEVQEGIIRSVGQVVTMFSTQLQAGPQP